MKFSKEKKGRLALLTEVLLWGSFPIFIQASSGVLPPLFFGAGASFFATLFFLVFVFFRKQSFAPLFSRAVFPSAFGAAFLISVVLFGILFWAGQKTSSGNIAILMTSEVFWTFFVFSFLGWEKITRTHFLGAFLVCVGALLVLAQNFSGYFVFADIVIFFTMLIAPFGNFLQKKVFSESSLECYGAFRSFLATIFLFFASFFLEGSPFSHSIDPFGFFLMAGVGILAFGMAKWLWFIALQNLPVSISIALANTSPPITLFLSIVFFHQFPNFFQILALPSIFLGVLLLNDFFLNQKKFTGTKISGDGRGSQIGFPTINLCLASKISRGVFTVLVNRKGKEFGGMGHFGARPTFEKNEFSAEIHLFDFSEHLTDGEEISFTVLQKIREIRKFENTKELIEQIEKDQEKAKKILKKRKGI